MINSDSACVFYTILANEQIDVASTDIRLTGVMPVFNISNRDVAVSAKQDPREGIGLGWSYIQK